MPPYCPTKVFFPSYASSHHPRAATQQPGGDAAAVAAQDDSEDEECDSFAAADAAFAAASAAPAVPRGDERTGLGVAGVLRRLRLWGREQAERGVIELEGREVTRWCKVTQRCGASRGCCSSSSRAQRRRQRGAAMGGGTC